jgi:mannose/cellobiose epimerase-like protein (N-acyl-D-glucosamine 2-epimerase family)
MLQNERGVLDLSTFPAIFKDGQFLKGHIMDIVGFYAPRCIDEKYGGYINCFLDDGTVCDYETKHLVGMSRFIYIFSAAAMISETPDKYREAVLHGLAFLEEHQLDKKNGGYYWILKGQKVQDPTKYAYGHAFETRYLNRAHLLAHSVMFKLLPQSGSLIWEHYDENWKIDWEYNKGNTKSEFRPYGTV